MTRKALSLGSVATALVLGQPAAAQTVIDGDTIELKGTIARHRRAGTSTGQEDAATSARRGVHGHKCVAPWQSRRGKE